MQPHIKHPWNVTPREAIRIQEQLRSRVVKRNRIGGKVRYVAGLDVAFPQSGRVTRAAVAVLSYPRLELVDQVVVERDTQMPYIPGLLSFREIPALLAALAKLRIWPQLFLCDGQGYAHPRRFGIASHLGVLLDAPSIGVGKSRLVGEDVQPGKQRGSWALLMHQGERVGAVLRTQDGVKPLYVSVGHRIALPTAVRWVLRLAPKYRLPETTRIADRLASGKAFSRAREATKGNPQMNANKRK